MSTIPARTATVDIYVGDYLDRIRHLEREYDSALAQEKSEGPRLNDEVPRSLEIREQHTALVAEANESAIQIVLRALRRSEWRELVQKYPPREGHKGDASAGVDESQFKDALVPVSIVSPSLTADDLDNLSDVDFDRLYFTAFALNRLPAASPKALNLPDSQTSQESDGTSS